MQNFSLPTTAEVKARAGTGGSSGTGTPWLGWAGLLLQALGANSQEAAERNALDEQKRQARMMQVLQSRDRRDIMQQQGIQNFNAERGMNMQGIGMLADMRSTQSGNSRYSAFRRDLGRAFQTLSGGI